MVDGACLEVFALILLNLFSCKRGFSKTFELLEAQRWPDLIKSIKDHEFKVHHHVLFVQYVSLKEDQISVHCHSSLPFPEILTQRVQDGADQADAEAIDRVDVQRSQVLVWTLFIDVVIDESIQELNDCICVQNLIVVCFSDKFDYSNTPL